MKLNGSHMSEEKKVMIDSGLVKETMDLIPEHTWPVVIDKLSAQIVDAMPSEHLEKLTGDPQGFEQAEKILLGFYLQSKEKREDIICDSFGFVGAETILYYLDGLQLDKIPDPKQQQEIS
tara:strand:+ start:132 stop:491 length:360 start_codon:yes stop_codon:yes gene_type:complete